MRIHCLRNEAAAVFKEQGLKLAFQALGDVKSKVNRRTRTEHLKQAVGHPNCQWLTTPTVDELMKYVSED